MEYCMKKYVIFLVLLLAACTAQPMAEQRDANAVSQGQVQIQINPPTDVAEDQVRSPAAPMAEGGESAESPLTPLEPTGSEYQPYSTLGCQNLLTKAEFAGICEKENVDVTSKLGTKNCYVALKDKEDPRLTAEVSLTSYKDAEAAMTEFDRRLKVFNVGADKSVGDKAYTFPKLDRETLTFVKGANFVDVGADTRLCTKVQVKMLAQAVAAKLS